MIDRASALARRPATLPIAVLALLAYLPALSAAPGRMPADSKLYLYLDPWGFFGDASTTFDASQFAGWVPHQHIAYLWPSLPWYTGFEALGVPDWVAHRLWIGTILLAAGLGVRWCAHTLGLSLAAAFAAAITYQLSLYILPYLSRTSVMLLPWAGLGWIVALTVRATRRPGWRDPAAIALVVLTIGAVNATALAMIVPAPALWLVHAGWARLVSWRDVVVIALRTAMLSALVSAWWVAALVVQGRRGVDVLPYSETLADVSLTATSPETWRGLGYWLFYIRDPFAPTTTESLRYLASTPAIAISFLVPILALASLACTQWVHRRYAALLIVAGLVLAVGVHPIDDRSPLMRILTGDGDSGLALALRSSTRALPVATLGLALALALAVDALGARPTRFGPTRRSLAGAAVALLAIANLPSLWTGGFVDPALERELNPPAAWTDAAAALDASGIDGRVLQLPGAEFGAFRWGYTVDQPLPGLTDKPVITRDLLPLGSPGAMDLLYAFDDRAQNGVLEPGTIAPVAALLGADAIWLANDLAFDRFRTARPEVVRDAVVGAPGIAEPEAFGAPMLNRPDVPVTDARSIGDRRVGAPVSPVEVAQVPATDGVIRARADTVIVAGDGEGVVDAAAVGLLDPSLHVVRYAADVAAHRATVDRDTPVVITDTNRDRARHWRGSQDTTGFTEAGDGTSDRAGEARLPVFPDASRDDATIAEQRGPVTATATGYGEPFAFLPEHRAFAAIDGDPTTAWLVGEHGDPIGETITLHHDRSLTSLRLHQPVSASNRHIVEVDINGERVVLDERSWSHEGQVVEFAPSTGSTNLTVLAVAGGVPFTRSAVAGVGFAEIAHDLGPTIEVVRPPTRVPTNGDGPLAYVFTRVRVDATDEWRDDPEERLVRQLDAERTRTFSPTYELRLDQRASDAHLAAAFAWPVVASTRLAGSPWHAGVAAFDGDPATSWVSAFDSGRGAELRLAHVDRPTTSVSIQQPIAGFSSIRTVRVAVGDDAREIDLSPDASGVAHAVVDPPLPPGPVTITVTDIDAVNTVDRRFGDPAELPVAVIDVELDSYDGLVAPLTWSTTTPCLPLISIDGTALTGRVTMTAQHGPVVEPARVQPCEQPTITAGSHLLREALDPTIADVLTLDRVVFDDGVARHLLAASDEPNPTATVLDRTRRTRTVRVDGCANGCWLVVGEGFNTAWSARHAGRSLGPPSRVDGGFNGWLLEPTTEPVTIDVEWTAQTPVTLAIWFSLAGALLAIALIIGPFIRRSRSVESDADDPGVGPAWSVDDAPTFALTPARLAREQILWPSIAWVAGSFLLIGPWWAVWGLVGAAALQVTRRRDLAALTAVSCLIVVAAGVALRERRSAPAPNGGWPTVFESLHGVGMFAVVCVLVVAVLPHRVRAR